VAPPTSSTSLAEAPTASTLLTCGTVRTRRDRSAAWAANPQQQSYDADLVHDLTGPHMPLLMTRSETEQLRSYRRCRTCAPATDHAVKTLPRRTIQAGNIPATYLGRDIEMVDGLSSAHSGGSPPRRGRTVSRSFCTPTAGALLRSQRTAIRGPVVAGRNQQVASGRLDRCAGYASSVTVSRQGRRYSVLSRPCGRDRPQAPN
jgi:hypothetical protein